MLCLLGIGICSILDMFLGAGTDEEIRWEGRGDIHIQDESRQARTETYLTHRLYGPTFQAADGQLDRAAMQAYRDGPEWRAAQDRMQRTTDQMQRQTIAQIGRLLSKNQKAKFKAMHGKDFDLTKLTNKPTAPLFTRRRPRPRQPGTSRNRPPGGRAPASRAPRLAPDAAHHRAESTLDFGSIAESVGGKTAGATPTAKGPTAHRTPLGRPTLASHRTNRQGTNRRNSPPSLRHPFPSSGPSTESPVSPPP
jgi:hypothetical protein